MFPIAKLLGQSQPTVNKLLGKPTNHQPIRDWDKFAGGTEVQYPDGTNWTLLDTAFHRERLSWITFFFKDPLPASEDQLFDVLGLDKSAFQKGKETSDETEYRGRVDRIVLKLTAGHPGPRDGKGYSHKVDIELVEVLN